VRALRARRWCDEVWTGKDTSMTASFKAVLAKIERNVRGTGSVERARTVAAVFANEGEIVLPPVELVLPDFAKAILNFTVPFDWKYYVKKYLSPSLSALKENGGSLVLDANPGSSLVRVFDPQRPLPLPGRYQVGMLPVYFAIALKKPWKRRIPLAIEFDEERIDIDPVAPAATAVTAAPPAAATGVSSPASASPILSSTSASSSPAATGSDYVASSVLEAAPVSSRARRHAKTTSEAAVVVSSVSSGTAAPAARSKNAALIRKAPAEAVDSENGPIKRPK